MKKLLNLDLKIDALKNLCEYFQFPVAIVNPLGKIDFINESYIKTFGYEKEEIQTSEQWFNLAYPDSEYREFIISDFQSQLNSERLNPEPRIFNVTCKNGLNKVIKFTLINIPDNNILVIGEDQTDKFDAEIELIDNLKKYRTLFLLSNDAIFLMDSETFLDCNPKTLELFGCEREQIIGTNPYSFSPEFQPDGVTSKEKALGYISDALEGKSQCFEWLHSKLDGSLFYAEVNLYSIVLSGSKKLYAIVRDITNRKETEKKLKSSEEMYRSLYENALIGFYRSSLDGKFIMANPALVKLLGYNSEKDLISNCLPNNCYLKIDDRNKFVDLLNQNEKVIGFNTTWRDIHGKILHIRENARSIKNNSGEIDYFEGTVEDVTIQKQFELKIKENEYRYRILFDLSPNAIMIESNEGIILDVNPAFCKSLLYNREDVIGKSVKFLASEESLNQVDSNISRILSGETLIHTVKSLRKDGTFAFMELKETAIPLHNEKTGIMVVINDITDRIKYEEKLILAKEKAELSDKLKSEFLAQISHEIRTPVNTVLSFTSLLLEEIPDSIKENLEFDYNSIINAGERIIRTIDMILNMSEIQTGTYEPNITKFNLLDEVLQKILNEFFIKAKNKNIKLNRNFNPGDYSIEADSYTVFQIFYNLVDNAIKYTPEGEVLISTSNNSEFVVVKVSDSGIGISEEYLPSIFDPFRQEEQGYTRGYEGNGLGLALVKNYCDLNNAKISVESEKGVGSKFTISIPKTRPV